MVKLPSELTVCTDRTNSVSPIFSISGRVGEPVGGDVLDRAIQQLRHPRGCRKTIERDQPPVFGSNIGREPRECRMKRNDGFEKQWLQTPR